jgi:hypothetical protein
MGTATTVGIVAGALLGSSTSRSGSGADRLVRLGKWASIDQISPLGVTDTVGVALGGTLY